MNRLLLICRGVPALYRFRLDRNYLTAEGAEGTEREDRDEYKRMRSDLMLIQFFGCISMNANILVGAKHFGSKSLVLTHKLCAEMLRPWQNEMHPIFPVKMPVPQ